jgi:hypothetical protein
MWQLTAMNEKLRNSTFHITLLMHKVHVNLLVAIDWDQGLEVWELIQFGFVFPPIISLFPEFRKALHVSSVTQNQAQALYRIMSGRSSRLTNNGAPYSQPSPSIASGKRFNDSFFFRSSKSGSGTSILNGRISDISVNILGFAKSSRALYQQLTDQEKIIFYSRKSNNKYEMPNDIATRITVIILAIMDVSWWYTTARDESWASLKLKSMSDS